MLNLHPPTVGFDTPNPEFLRALRGEVAFEAFVGLGPFQDEVSVPITVCSAVHWYHISTPNRESAEIRSGAIDGRLVQRADLDEIVADIQQLAVPVLLWVGREFLWTMARSTKSWGALKRELCRLITTAPRGSVLLLDGLESLDHAKQRLIGGPRSPAVTEVYVALAELGIRLYVLGDVAIAGPNETMCPVSPVIEALTVSRLFDGTNLDIQEIFEAEAIIIRAGGNERDALRAAAERGCLDGIPPVSAYARLWFALSLLGENRFAEANQQLVAAIRSGCGHWRTQWYLGLAARGIGDLHAARVFTAQVLARYPRFRAARQLLEEIAVMDASVLHSTGLKTRLRVGQEVGDTTPIQLDRGDLVFDIGANVGRKAELFLAQGARVVCVEPQPKCLDVLRKKFSEDDRVMIVPAGVAACPGELQLSICGATDLISTFSEQWKTGRFSGYAWDEKINVPVTTLDELIARFGLPTYCKIDVEGFEREVLKGLHTTLPVLSFEFAIEFIESAERCADYLQSIGFRAFNVALGEANTFLFQEAVSCAELFSYLKVSSDQNLWGDIYAGTVAKVSRSPVAHGSI